MTLPVFAGVVVAALAGCASPRQEQRQDDIKTCAKLGLPYPSQDNMLCVQRQQRQRDSQPTSQGLQDATHRMS